ncbi:DinB family protein [Guptibacillus algicola]|uniref:DinB family protein n=1 Tax=Guptibacillus algicola TaxID=225844 RepID=UPI001CD693B9|nr:DinB family protein [Alkalihalobacillus algicola]MCA0988550.1 DinB family protein [Alkalihalobacillus algicola]
MKKVHNLSMIEDIEGFSSEVSRLVSMMNYTRHTTEEAIRGLTTEQLDFHIDNESNSIAMLLQHIVSLEKAFQIMTFEQRELTDAEWEKLGVAIELGERAKDKIRGRDLDYYWSEMSLVRENTLQELQKKDDDWLDVITPYGWDEKANHYFKWFHVMEDELSHRGQIRMIRKRIDA